MIGADEMVVSDRFGSVVFVTRGPNAEQTINDYLANCRMLGFETSGRTITNANFAEVRAAVFRDSIVRGTSRPN